MQAVSIEERLNVSGDRLRRGRVTAMTQAATTSSVAKDRRRAPTDDASRREIENHRKVSTRDSNVTVYEDPSRTPSTHSASRSVHNNDYEVAGRVQLDARLSLPLGRLAVLDGLSQSTIRGQSRMKVSVREPHSDQRDHPVGRPDGVGRGHRCWSASSGEARRSRSTRPRAERRAKDQTTLHASSAPTARASFRAKAMMAT
jgi:hypothetical protein